MTETVEMTGHGKEGKPKAGFPSFPQPLEIASRFPHSHRTAATILTQKTTTRKGHPKRSLRYRPSGSFFNEKMLPRKLALNGRCLHLEIFGEEYPQPILFPSLPQ